MVLAERTRRVMLADEWRGLVVLLMVVYHGLYDLVVFHGVDLPGFFTGWGRVLQLFICVSFITISGLCCRFSHSNLRRGLLTFGLGMALTLATAVATPEVVIRFGVLHLLGAAMLLYPPLRPLLDRLPAGWGAGLFAALFLLTFQVPQGTLGLGPLAATLPPALYQSRWLFWLGLPGPGFFSGDYFPLAPWLFLFLAGTFLGRFAAEGRLPAFVYQPHAPLLAAVGRRSIWVYLIHQPLLYGALQLLFALR